MVRAISSEPSQPSREQTKPSPEGGRTNQATSVQFDLAMKATRGGAPDQTSAREPTHKGEEPTQQDLAKARDGQVTYTVQPGDNLSAIAARFGLNLADLKAADPKFFPPNVNSNLIHAGQKLLVLNKTLSENAVAMAETKDATKLRSLIAFDLRYTTRSLATPGDQLSAQEKILIARRPNDPAFAALVKDEGQTLTQLWTSQGRTHAIWDPLNKLAADGDRNGLTREIDSQIRNLTATSPTVNAVNDYKNMLLTYGPHNPQFAASVNQAVHKFLSNPEGGIFGSNGAGVPAADRRFLEGLSHGIDAELYGIGGQSHKGPATGVIHPDTQYGIQQQYLAGKVGNGNESPSQRLANMMSVLGPTRTYAVLANMTPAQAQQLGIQNSLNTLTDNLQLTAGDAKNLALAQANFATSESQYDFPGIGWVGSLMNSLPNDQNGTAVKVGYAQGCITGAQQLAQEIGSGKYSGQVQNQLTATLNGLCENATNLSAGFTDPVKEQLFSQLHTAATQLAGTGAAKQSDVLNAYAANILGSLRDKSQIAATLRAMGGVGADGAIDPNLDLAKFLQSALSGQSQLGIASYFSNMMTPNGQMPQGVTSLLKAISGSGNPKLMAGTLDTVMQWTIKNPTQAEVLTAQDTGNGATGYRNALTSILDKSFNQFVALDPSKTNATLVRTMQPQTIADLQALSAVEMGPPYDSKIAGNFAQVFGTHAVQFAAYADDQAKYPQLDSLLADGGDPRNSAAVIFGQLMNGLGAGLNQSQASFQAQAHAAQAAADQTLLEARVFTDILRGFGTGTLLASAWITGGAAVPIGLGAVANGEKLASIFGRVGLFSGSIGTAVLDAFFSNTAQQNQAKAEEQAVQKVAQGMQAADVKPTQLLQQIYNGWFSNISQLPGAEGQTITDGVMTGSSFAAAPTIETGVQYFYAAYNPSDYYRSQTGQYPSAG
jgi:LysM repeat protein